MALSRSGVIWCGDERRSGVLLDPAHPWNPMARHWLSLMFSAEPEDISTRDAGSYDDTGLNLAVEDGYGALIAKLAAGAKGKQEMLTGASSMTAYTVNTTPDASTSHSTMPRNWRSSTYA